MKQYAEEDDCVVGKVKIEGERTLSRSNVPPTIVTLPLIVRPNRIKNTFVGLSSAALGVALLVSAVLAVSESSAQSSLGHLTALLAVGFAIFMLGVGLAGVALTCIVDACRSSPVLVLDIDGFNDNRSGASARWAEVRDAKLLKTKFGPAAVDLHLWKAVNANQNPFRVGILGFRWLPKADRILISIAFANTSPHTLGYTILSLAGGHRNPPRPKGQ